ncbi:hypothetical protein BKG91_03150 [Rodentibacter caecimuris]|uniref:DUF945 domain-containing protein n=1 Tax=Rodentibacter caecimuris TaxID=1796644 RepID=A0AAJ3K6X4_9PAST|nr:Uncharacterized protein AC062_1673 [Pasteurellaceae bacterium NI1060]MCQ9124408.1 hypothetical protein [Rodentibacter heylii]OOF73407.1 hypothetical protein BKG90_00890 [Rodentibacter heylii]OOF75460.1 hypothetical protein BKG91_03150 [Rodentibacter heylii]OOF77712.1 hypothetical protein BKG99_02290 [Rodentibacter heylii]
MIKKTKITLSLSALIVVSGIGAQIYTNHKVDQVLQNFPYSLDNQAKLLVSQTSKNIFTRHLTFSLQNNDNEKTDLITSKLTTLPFFITAESNLSEKFVRQLNKTLNITIDKNTINTKFSPIGDYFSSDILTEFRDFANKSQQSTISLNFRENKEIDLNANLTGFNYDNDSKLKKLEGKFHLIPVTPSQYDLTHIELTAENAELALLNGENTRLQLKNTTYKFNKNKENNTEKRDLTTKLSSDILRISNKNRTTEESQTTFGGLNISLNQQGVPSAVNFYNEFKKLSTGDQNIRNGVDLLIAILTKNDYFDSKVSVISVNAPKKQKPYFNLQNGNIALKLDNTDLTKSNANFELLVGSVKQTPEDNAQKWDAKDGKLSVQLKDYNIANELSLIPFFLETLTVKSPPSKDNKDFLHLKDKWVREFKENSNIDFSLHSLNLFENKITALTFNNKSRSESDQYSTSFTLNTKKISVPEQSMQIEDLSISIPLKLNDPRSYWSSAFCLGAYETLCQTYLTTATQEKYLNNAWSDLNFILDHTNVTFNLNTSPETKAYPVKFEANGMMTKAPEDAKSSQDWSFLDRTEGLLRISFDKRLVEIQDEKTSKIKEQSLFWNMIQSEIKPYDTILPAFVAEGENYVAKFEKNDNGYFINGKSFEEIEEESSSEK